MCLETVQVAPQPPVGSKFRSPGRGQSHGDARNQKLPVKCRKWPDTQPWEQLPRGRGDGDICPGRLAASAHGAGHVTRLQRREARARTQPLGGHVEGHGGVGRGPASCGRRGRHRKGRRSGSGREPWVRRRPVPSRGPPGGSGWTRGGLPLTLRAVAPRVPFGDKIKGVEEACP